MLQFLKSSERLLVKSKTGWPVVIASDVLRELHGYRQLSLDSPEAGGVLLGKILLADGAGIVEALTKPGRGDRQSRYGFFRSERHDRETNRYWRNTALTGAYLGLWHSHPESNPTPSSVDIADWARALRNDTFPGQGLVFAIVGFDSLTIWMGAKGKRPHPAGHWSWELSNV